MCKDIGMDCCFEVHAQNEMELMRKFIHHAEPAHNMPVLPAEVIAKIQKAIKK
jgi:predicted small metal-binding protein